MVCQTKFTFNYLMISSTFFWTYFSKKKWIISEEIGIIVWWSYNYVGLRNPRRGCGESLFVGSICDILTWAEAAASILIFLFLLPPKNIVVYWYPNYVILQDSWCIFIGNINIMWILLNINTIIATNDSKKFEWNNTFLFLSLDLIFFPIMFNMFLVVFWSQHARSQFSICLSN